jgi:hypothetical protein
MIQTKDGVRFHDPILNALQVASELLGFPLVITSGIDGAHSGSNDPHHLGRAYDIRTYNWPQHENIHSPNDVLGLIMRCFNDGPLEKKDGGLVSANYFGWLENAGQPGEHLHVQVRRAVVPTPTI